MELGIDVGEVDLVLQIGCPLTVSGALQRMGRAGHNPGRVSVMHIFPRTAAEGIPCALTATAALEGEIEPAKPPRGCYDCLLYTSGLSWKRGGHIVVQCKADLLLQRLQFPLHSIHQKLVASGSRSKPTQPFRSAISCTSETSSSKSNTFRFS